MARQKIENIGLVNKDCDEPTVIPSRKKYVIAALASLLAVVVIAAVSAVAIRSYTFEKNKYVFS